MHLLLGPSLPEVVLVLSLRLAVFGLSHSGSVHGLCCLCGVVTPVSFHLAWMSAVVAWCLASSSCATNFWI